MFAALPAVLDCSTSAPAPLSSAGLPASPHRLRSCRCRAGPWATPGWGSPDSRWPAACAAPPAPPWRAAARWWGCISHRCSPWTGSTACDLWAKTARRGSGTAHTWGSSGEGPGAEKPEHPCKDTGTRSHSFCPAQRVFRDAQVRERRRACDVVPEVDGSTLAHAWQEEDKRCWLAVGIHLSCGWQRRYASARHALMETSNQTMRQDRLQAGKISKRRGKKQDQVPTSEFLFYRRFWRRFKPFSRFSVETENPKKDV